MKKVKHNLAHDIAIDLGTANTLVATLGDGLVIDEPSVVAVNKNTKSIIAIGKKAQEMIGKAPDDIEIIRPLLDGVVSNYEITEHMLKHFIDEVHRRHKVIWPQPRLIIGLPSGVTEVEQRAVLEAGRNAGARKVYLIEEPMAAAIGARIKSEPQDVLSNKGTMVVDIGGGTAEVAVIANGKIVVLKSLRIAGDELTEVIVRYMRDEFGLQLGVQSAQEAKHKIGSVFPKNDPDNKHKVRGVNVISGLPKEMSLTTESLSIPLLKQCRPIIVAIRSALEETPTELVADIMQNPIILAGGGSLIGGLPELIQQETKLKALVAENALTAVTEGAFTALSQLDKYRQVLVKSGGKF